VLRPQPGAMQVTARVPALGNQAFALGIPETIGCREAMLVNFPEAKIDWQGPDEHGVVSCSWGPGGRIAYTLRLVPADDYIDVEMTIRNHTEFLWRDVFAFNCINPIQARTFQDWKLQRTYMSREGKPFRMSETTRVQGHMPTVGFYLPEHVRAGEESVFVRGFGATSPDRTDGSWIVTLSEPAGSYMAATAMEVRSCSITWTAAASTPRPASATSGRARRARRSAASTWLGERWTTSCGAWKPTAWRWRRGRSGRGRRSPQRPRNRTGGWN
jgi:hypothetical protein